MRLNRRRRNEPPPAQNGLQLLTLSLFIMLLAFFIVLNALSSFEEVKVKPIIDSVSSAFSGEVQRVDKAPSVTPNPENSVNEGETVERLDALFTAEIATFDATKSVRTGIMNVVLSKEDFAKAMKASGQEDLTKVQNVSGLKTYFLPTLVSVLQSDRQGRPYRMDIVFHTKDNPSLLQNSDPAVLRAAMRDVAVYANILEKSGMPENLIGIAVEKGDPATVALFFRPHVPYSPVGAQYQGGAQ